jgi:hypothetical protein
LVEFFHILTLLSFAIILSISDDLKSYLIMRLSLLFAAVSVPWAAAFSFNGYDLGFQGFYPRQHFHSVNFEPPAPKITHWDSRCDSGKLLLTPRGPFVTGRARGPVILDPKGNLVWMENEQFQQAMNLNVQKYKGEDYLTFWTKDVKIPKKSKHAEEASHSKTHPRKSYVLVGLIRFPIVYISDSLA